jgi:hypothetical protein
VGVSEAKKRAGISPALLVTHPFHALVLPEQMTLVYPRAPFLAGIENTFDLNDVLCKNAVWQNLIMKT